jgi:hypothetical protein
MAKQIIADPAVFGWAWPIFGSGARVDAVGGLAVGAFAERIIWAMSHVVSRLAWRCQAAPGMAEYCDLRPLRAALSWSVR